MKMKGKDDSDKKEKDKGVNEDLIMVTDEDQVVMEPKDPRLHSIVIEASKSVHEDDSILLIEDTDIQGKDVGNIYLARQLDRMREVIRTSCDRKKAKRKLK